MKFEEFKQSQKLEKIECQSVEVTEKGTGVCVFDVTTYSGKTYKVNVYGSLNNLDELTIDSPVRFPHAKEGKILETAKNKIKEQLEKNKQIKE